MIQPQIQSVKGPFICNNSKNSIQKIKRFNFLLTLIFKILVAKNSIQNAQTAWSNAQKSSAPTILIRNTSNKRQGNNLGSSHPALWIQMNVQICLIELGLGRARTNFGPQRAFQFTKDNIMGLPAFKSKCQRYFCVWNFAWIGYGWIMLFPSLQRSLLQPSKSPKHLQIHRFPFPFSTVISILAFETEIETWEEKHGNPFWSWVVCDKPH